MASRFVLPFADVGGGISPSDGAKLEFFITGTSTQKDTFSDEALTIKNANPVIADGNGVFPAIWLPDGGRYKVTLDDKNIVQKFEADPVVGGVSASLSAKTFDIVAAMIASTELNIGDIVDTAGYTAKGDGGQNQYEIVAAATGTADGGSFIDLAVHQAKGLFPGGFIIPDQFGAVRDGVTDDASKLQATLSFIATKSRGGELFLNEGVYSLGAQLTYANKPLTISGKGIDISILEWTNASGGLALSDNTGDATPISHFNVKDMTLRTTQAGGGTALSIVYNPKTDNPSMPHIGLSNLNIHGSGDIAAKFWTKGVVLTDASGVRASNINIIASGSNPLIGFDLAYGNSAGRFDIHLAKLNIQGHQTGLKIRGHVESIFILDPEIVGQEICIDADVTGTTIPGGRNPVLQLVGGHMNSKKTTVNVKSWKVVKILGTDMFHGVGTDDVAGDNVLISLCQYVTITGAKVGSGVLTVSRNGIKMNDVDDWSVTGCDFEFLSTSAIVVQGTTGKRGVISGCVLNGNSGTTMNEGINIISTSGKVAITGNYIQNAVDGIRFSTGQFSTAMNNIIEDCTDGIEIVAGSINNRALNNTFINCTTNQNIGDVNNEFDIEHTFTFDPPSLADGARTTQLETVTGARFGDMVDVAAPYDIQDMIITANIQNVDTVGVYIHNESGGTKDLGSGTWKFRIRKRLFP